MKALKTLFLFTISIVLASCFDSPEFDDKPKIEFNSIYFGLSTDPDKADSLVVELDFEDGDGNLGLGNEHRNDPFHEYEYFLTDGSDIVATVRERYPDGVNRAFLDVPAGVTGKLVRPGDMPGLPPNNCDNFRTGKLYVFPDDARIFDETYTVTELTNPFYYEVSGTFLTERNENNKNISVRFFRLINQSLQEYSWPCQNFDGRFEVLTDKETALSGTLRYTMSSFGFATEMATGAWQLRIQIKDRDLNVSNEITTQVFTLNQIKRN